MSGSPVVIDGKLVGAIAYGFSQGPSTFGGVTPINEMLQVASRPRMVEAAAPLALSGAALRAIDRVAPAAAGPFVRLPLPITMPMRTSVRTKGVKSATRVARMRARADLSTALRRAGFDLVGTTGGRSIKASASGGPIGSGDDIAVSLATGDALTAATGTVTWTCDQKLLAFGHPMLQTGASNLGAHQAKAIDVVDDSVLGPFHLAVPGALVGRVAEDQSDRHRRASRPGTPARAPTSRPPRPTGPPAATARATCPPNPPVCARPSWGCMRAPTSRRPPRPMPRVR